MPLFQPIKTSRCEAGTERLRRFYCWRESELIGKPANEVLRSRYPDGKTSKELVDQLLVTNAWTGEAIQKRKDATDVSVLSSVTVLKDDEGNFVGAVAVNHDITERKRAEEELQKSEDRFRVLNRKT